MVFHTVELLLLCSGQDIGHHRPDQRHLGLLHQRRGQAVRLQILTYLLQLISLAPLQCMPSMPTVQYRMVQTCELEQVLPIILYIPALYCGGRVYVSHRWGKDVRLCPVYSCLY
jgi:hypothetical protein